MGATSARPSHCFTMNGALRIVSSARILWLLVFLALKPFPATPLAADQLYRFGEQDESLPITQDAHSVEVPVTVKIVHFQDQFGSIFVNENGLLSFMTHIPQFYPNEFPLFYPIIAPLYSDLDTRGHGKVYYRETKEPSLLDRATSEVHEYFRDGRTFRTKSLFIVTWSEVAMNNSTHSPRNTAQVVIASNGTQSYCFFLYPENGVQWSQSEMEGNSPMPYTQAGFMSGQSSFYKLPGSGTDQVRNYPRMSNVNRPGVFAFQMGATANGNIGLPDRNVESEDSQASRSCSKNFFPCLPTADCQQYDTGFCCACQSGYIGNGRSCIKNDNGIHINGRMTGTINDIVLEDVQLYTYASLKEGRVYTTANRISPDLGYDLQAALMPLAGIIGWLFALPANSSSVPNGFTLTGGVFNRTVDIVFPMDGSNLRIVEQYQGLDLFNFLNYRIEVMGHVPTVPSDSNVMLDPYTERFHKIARNTIKSHLMHQYKFGENSASMPISVDQTIQFEDCSHRPQEEVFFNAISEVSVAPNHMQYQVPEQVTRYTFESKISTVAGENPCSSVTCGMFSSCTIEGNQHRCRCNKGFEALASITSDDDPVCEDIDECQLARCSPNAFCVNTPGSFSCRCREGFYGDGFSCSQIQESPEFGCNMLQCDVNAECIPTKHLGPRCRCKVGYIGDGRRCTPEVQEKDTDDCRTLSLCDQKAECRLNRLNGTYSCVCLPKYRGDGIVCTAESESCEKKDNCDVDAECIRAPESGNEFYCKCNQGFVGDGYSCVPEISDDDCSTQNNCHRDAECLQQDGTFKCHCRGGFLGDGYFCRLESENVVNICGESGACSSDAECRFNSETQTSQCVCLDGFIGNGQICNANNECDSSQPESVCDRHAECRFNAAMMRHECQCRLGFAGNGVRCTTDENVGCNVVNDCHKNASCIIDPYTMNYHCRCNSGFEGDGKKQCSAHVTCDRINNCDVHAQCTYDDQLETHRCVCREGYLGTGFQCKALKSCGEDRSICSPHADCEFNYVLKQHACRCHYGFIGDGYQCAPAPLFDGDFLLFSQGSSVLRMENPLNHKDASSIPGHPLLTRTGQTIVGLDVDCLTGKVYWSDLAGGAIYSSTYNGTGTTMVFGPNMTESVIMSPEGVAVDWVSRNIYWIDSQKRTIEVATLDGLLHKVLFSDGLVNPRGIALHPGSGKLYWTDWEREKPRIEFANLDGRDRGVLIEQDIKVPNNLLVDFEHNDLCWTDSELHRIECMNLFTMSRRVIFTQASYPFDLAIAHNTFYWSDWDSKTIYQIDRNGGVATALDLPRGGHGRPYGVVSVPKHCPTITNACSLNKGNCRHFCLPNDRGRTCACPDMAYEEDDGCNEI